MVPTRLGVSPALHGGGHGDILAPEEAQGYIDLNERVLGLRCWVFWVTVYKVTV